MIINASLFCTDAPGLYKEAIHESAPIICTCSACLRNIPWMGFQHGPYYNFESGDGKIFKYMLMYSSSSIV